MAPRPQGCGNRSVGETCQAPARRGAQGFLLPVSVMVMITMTSVHIYSLPRITRALPESHHALSSPRPQALCSRPSRNKTSGKRVSVCRSVQGNRGRGSLGRVVLCFLPGHTVIHARRSSREHPRAFIESLKNNYSRIGAILCSYRQQAPK